MLKRFVRSPVLAVIVFLGVASTAAPDAAAQGQGASAFIQNLGSQGMQALSLPEYQRIGRFRQLLQTEFDLADIARFVLGQYARMMPPQEQQDFMGLFAEYIARSYATRLAAYAGAPFRVTGERTSYGETVVISQVSRPGGQPAEIDWHVVNAGGRYLVDDVVVGGVSMKVSQRSEFASIIQRNGGQPGALLAALREQMGYGSSRK